MSRKAGKEKQVSGFCKQKCVGCYWENAITVKDCPCLECSRFCGPFSMDEPYDFWMTVRATELQAKLMVMASNALHREYDEALDVCPTLMSAARELMRVPVWRTDTPTGNTDQLLIYAQVKGRSLPQLYLGWWRTNTGWTIPGLWHSYYEGMMEVLAWTEASGPLASQIKQEAE